MREILFRGKRTDNGAWVYGAFCLKDADSPFGEMLDRPSIIKYDPPCDGFWYRVNQETVGQYTGIDDALGNAVYEGDICSFDDELMVVEWHEEDAMFFMRSLDGTNWTTNFSEVSGREIKVMYNIHDNPELLEKGGT